MDHPTKTGFFHRDLCQQNSWTSSGHTRGRTAEQSKVHTNKQSTQVLQGHTASSWWQARLKCMTFTYCLSGSFLRFWYKSQSRAEFLYFFLFPIPHFYYCVLTGCLRNSYWMFEVSACQLYFNNLFAITQGRQSLMLRARSAIWRPRALLQATKPVHLLKLKLRKMLGFYRKGF